ncbi:MAG: hypothetical protein WC301_06605 [Candidatus Omnitrophota bacterium]|jgi:4-amino-4-deoxy-L-arabinose transferase-like glycosyltransferase
MGSILIDSRKKILPAVIFLFVSIFAFLSALKAGERGFFAFDQSIVFDGGYRILSGQVPYKDFVIPLGPAAFWIQAAFFRLFGVSYSSYIFTSAVINTLAAICGMLIIRMLFPYHRLLSYACGFITAAWFLPPFGTLWVDQVSFFLSFLAIAALLFSCFYRAGSRAISSFSLAISGFLALFSILAKQNAGLYILPLYFILLLAARLPGLKTVLYNWFIFSCGFISGLLLFIVWLWVRSDVNIFLQYAVYIPSLLGVDRILQAKEELFGIFSGVGSKYAQLYYLPASIIFILASSFIISVFTFIASIRGKGERGLQDKKGLLASILCLYVIIFQYVFIHTTMNEAENSIPFIGIILAIAIALLTRLYEPLRLKVKFAYPGIMPVTVISLLTVYLSIAGINVSLSRKVHGFSGAGFGESFTLDRLRGLRWALPTMAGEAAVKESDITDLFNYLKAKNSNFFIFPNFTFFYGLLDAPSPQPLLWFHKGLTYHVIYDAALDKWIVDSLGKNEVRAIIIEDKPDYNHYMLNDFPALKAYITDNFVKTKELGIFNIYEKTDPRLL